MAIGGGPCGTDHGGLTTGVPGEAEGVVDGEELRRGVGGGVADADREGGQMPGGVLADGGQHSPLAAVLRLHVVRGAGEEVHHDRLPDAAVWPGRELGAVPLLRRLRPPRVVDQNILLLP